MTTAERFDELAAQYGARAEALAAMIPAVEDRDPNSNASWMMHETELARVLEAQAHWQMMAETARQTTSGEPASDPAAG
jgi:hypothetical protein